MPVSPGRRPELGKEYGIPLCSRRAAARAPGIFRERGGHASAPATRAPSGDLNHGEVGARLPRRAGARPDEPPAAAPPLARPAVQPFTQLCVRYFPDRPTRAGRGALTSDGRGRASWHVRCNVPARTARVRGMSNGSRGSFGCRLRGRFDGLNGGSLPSPGRPGRTARRAALRTVNGGPAVSHAQPTQNSSESPRGVVVRPSRAQFRVARG
jgi:hypothetical protein